VERTEGEGERGKGFGAVGDLAATVQCGGSRGRESLVEVGCPRGNDREREKERALGFMYVCESLPYLCREVALCVCGRESFVCSRFCCLVWLGEKGSGGRESFRGGVGVGSGGRERERERESEVADLLWKEFLVLLWVGLDYCCEE
jgi:hypothetical protein